MIDIIILAAGKGTRMRSAKPKVLHTLAGKSFLAHVIDCAQTLGPQQIHLVVGHGAEQVEAAFALDESLSFVQQTEQLGTGHAVQQAVPGLDKDSISLILYGDVPLIQASTLKQLLSCASDSAMGLLTIELDDPTGYGRIVRDKADKIAAIVEQKDATPEQLRISEVNTGVMALKNKHLIRWLEQLSNDNAQGEYYLTDIIEMAVNDAVQVIACHPTSAMEVAGVNNRKQQAELEREYQRLLAEQLMDDGVALSDPSRFDLRGQLTAGSDCFIDINCVFEGENTIGNNVTFEQNCTIKNAKIGDNSIILANSVLENCEVAENCNIGPFARLRPGTKLASGAKIGNFVETKNANIGVNSKVNHLSYVGDADVGEEVNIGAGTITCNYDGANKHRTEIGDGAFIGSNSALVAPIKIGAGATVGAGSTLSNDAAENTLVVARPKARAIPGWERPKKAPK